MHCVFLFPTADEAALFRAQAPDADVRICGVGMAAAAAVTSGVVQERPTAVVLCGVAGARRGEAVERGGVVQVVNESVAGLPACYREEYRPTLRAKGLHEVVSQTVNHTGDSHKGQIENMEGAAVMAVCAASNIACMEVRAVSNYTDEPRAEWCIGEALQNLTAALMRLEIEKI